MTRTGNGDTPQETQQGEPSQSERRSVPVSILILGVCALGIGIYVGTQALPVLYAMLFPPLPPIPANSQQTAHRTPDDGLDEWDYEIDEQACKVLQFYQDMGARCDVSPLWCGGGVSTDLMKIPNFRRQRIALCTGDKDFTVFAMRWKAEIWTADEIPNLKSQVKLSRQIYWGGALPQLTTPTPLP